MKKIKVTVIALAAIALGAMAFRSSEGGSITGKVRPMDGATEAWAIQGSDTLKTAVFDGAFTFKDARAGSYTVIINAKEPFKDATLNDVKVEDGKATDLGEINLQQ
ncbi:carboxypeptidase-like regulatory domain-containing protein [uncultured Chitinophaga sp.]|jgi:hypothetical protein|uniref:carboxypeptidase-like regulatory domain-containing protein n=1 Tax=uncultured Chitinophaga sp. TaxID=339340 RepID=UPI0026367E23|nr:carboxypeptidase-like regulatory domain-containing protein [uncultured Chitinophaga sp.]